MCPKTLPFPTPSAGQQVSPETSSPWATKTDSQHLVSINSSISSPGYAGKFQRAQTTTLSSGRVLTLKRGTQMNAVRCARPVVPPAAAQGAAEPGAGVCVPAPDCGLPDPRAHFLALATTPAAGGRERQTADRWPGHWSPGQPRAQLLPAVPFQHPRGPVPTATTPLDTHIVPPPWPLPSGQQNRSQSARCQRDLGPGTKPPSEMGESRGPWLSSWR